MCLRCGAEVRPALSMVRRLGSSCAICARRAPRSYFRLATGEAAAVVEARALVPLEPYPGNALKRWRVLCTICGTDGERTLQSIGRSRRVGCANCARSSARRTYLITKPLPALRPLLRLARRLEDHDAATVVTVMLGERQNDG